MESENRVIQGLWIGGQLSLMEQLSIQSFLKNGHEYHLYVYGDVKNVPENTIIKDGNEILPQDRIFTYQTGWGKGSYAGFADLFRYHLLNQKGGWWVDTDVICLKPFNFKSDYVIASSYEGIWGSPAITCVLKLQKNSTFTNYLVETSDRTDPAQISYGDIGPFLLQRAVAELKFEQYVVPYDYFCPITWRAVKKIVYPCEKLSLHKTIESAKDLVRPILRPHTKTGKLTRNSHALHLWNEIWRQNNLNKNASFDKRCLYERLKQRYLCSPSS
ncbi:hypothetical protein HJG54_30920 [Leptolyngbya sp. NK1-12]|uniref:Alpha 1,4-glycosyltransferase domain-containing protein n=1 Tax=Leptolyngbya sp. NK1-12 TaxID=2547451 RepID=A0AA97ASM6_9CYAN|nr:hypothetical protein HJG54_30920 [Leptolyngbya sp. NK1-12]